MITIIIGICNFIISGLWLGTIFNDKALGNPIAKKQYVWTAISMSAGIVCIVTGIGIITR